MAPDRLQSERLFDGSSQPFESKGRYAPLPFRVGENLANAVSWLSD
jgi:hypothetical protein